MDSLQIHKIKNIFINYNDQYEIRKLIANLFIPSNQEKKINAEVSTPPNLVDEMLDKIPEDFWTTPKKIFEPCCGKGNFVLAIVHKLFYGLQNMFPDIQERCNLIFNQCLYYADISPYNIQITTQLLKKYFKYKYNIIIQKFNSYTGNTLQLDIQDVYRIDGFDAVIGNPPYNRSQNNTGKKGGGDLIWDEFIHKSLDCLNEYGYLCFVHPSAWRKPQDKNTKTKGLYDLMTNKNHLLYLEIHDTKDGKTTFGVGTRYDWYILQKVYSDKPTIVKDQLGLYHNIQLKEWIFLPNHSYDIIKTLLGVSNDVIYSGNQYDIRKKWVIYIRNQYGSDKKCIKDTKTDEFKYPLIHSTTKKGVRYKWTNTLNPPVRNKINMFGVPKVIFGDSGINDIIIDMEGKYGLTNHAIGIKINSMEEGIKIKTVLESEMFKDVLNACSWSNFMIEWRIFKYLKKDFWKEFID